MAAVVTTQQQQHKRRFRHRRVRSEGLGLAAAATAPAAPLLVPPARFPAEAAAAVDTAPFFDGAGRSAGFSTVVGLGTDVADGAAAGVFRRDAASRAASLCEPPASATHAETLLPLAQQPPLPPLPLPKPQSQPPWSAAAAAPLTGDRADSDMLFGEDDAADPHARLPPPPPGAPRNGGICAIAPPPPPPELGPAAALRAFLAAVALASSASCRMLAPPGCGLLSFFLRSMRGAAGRAQRPFAKFSQKLMGAPAVWVCGAGGRHVTVNDAPKGPPRESESTYAAAAPPFLCLFLRTVPAVEVRDRRAAAPPPLPRSRLARPPAACSR